MSTINDTGVRSNRNPILAGFRYDGALHSSGSDAHYRAWCASNWATKLAAVESPDDHWLVGTTVSEQVFAARVLYRYAAVFGGVA